MSSNDFPEDIPDDPAGDPEDAPEIKDQPGPWDEIVNRTILIAPWVAIAAVGIYLVATGSISTDITVGGTIPVRPFAYLAAGVIGLTYFLAVAKFYGLKPLAWVINAIANIADSYERDE